MNPWLHLQCQFNRFRSTGPSGERMAVRHLRRQRHRILARNLRNQLGEIDIVAQALDRQTLVIAEVKATKSGSSDTPPEVHVNEQKQRKLTIQACKLARRYGMTDRPIRFDVVGVYLAGLDGEPAIHHHIGAFESTI